DDGVTDWSSGVHARSEAVVAVDPHRDPACWQIEVGEDLQRVIIVVGAVVGHARYVLRPVVRKVAFPTVFPVIDGLGFVEVLISKNIVGEDFRMSDGVGSVPPGQLILGPGDRVGLSGALPRSHEKPGLAGVGRTGRKIGRYSVAESDGEANGARRGYGRLCGQRRFA